MSINTRSMRILRKLGAYDSEKQTSSGLILGACMVLALLFCLVAVSGCAWASEIKEADAIKAIIGEAENQGYKGMCLVALAIRNRGTLQGVYGLHANRVVNHKYSDTTHKLAKKAWETSKGMPDILCSADHWENIRAFGRPYWVASMVETFRYRDHIFYRKKEV